MTATTAQPSTLPATESIRELFPALERVHHGRPVAYFDGPGGTQVPRVVVDAMADYLLGHNANTHWNYPTSSETDRMIAAAREAGADFVNGSPDEIAFGNNMTTITFHLARALGRRWGAGDEVVVTELDHHANVAPWHELARERGVTIRTVRMLPGRGILDWEDLAAAITPATRLVAIGAASNALGTITDIRPVGDLARAVGALVFVDAVHFAAHAVTDVRAWGCDALVCSPYKFYGPHAGMSWVRRDLLDAIDVPRLDPAPDEGPERLETGTQNHEGIIGTGAAIDFLASLGAGGSRRERLVRAMDGLHARGHELFTRLWNGLQGIDAVTMFGLPPGADRTPTLSFVVSGIAADEVSTRLADAGVFVSHGDFYATTVIERLGHAADGVVRAGCACYTSVDEVDRLITEVRTLAARR
jgi:cysteine desulfurase family protein (TIGR01976 family)